MLTSPAAAPEVQRSGRSRLVIGAAAFVAFLVTTVVLRTLFDDDEPAEVPTAEPDRSELRVFLDTDVTPAQRDQVRDELTADPSVTDLEFLDDEATLAEFAAMFPDRDAPPAGVLPTSFVVQVDGEGTELAALINRAEVLPGVRDVTVAPLDQPPTVAEPPPYHGDVLVFFNPSASESQIDAVGARLEASELVADLEFVDQEEALADFEQMFSHDPALLATVEADLLPPSFGVVAAGDPADTLAFACELEDEPGVRQVEGLGGHHCPTG